jgi:multiple sugar transport system permease protein
MKKRDHYGYIFIAPFFLVFFVFLIYPVLLTLFYTFTDFKGFGEYNMTGLANWQRLFTDKQMGVAFVNTWKIWGMNIVVQLGLAFILVFIFSDIVWKIKAVGFFRTLFYLPNLITLASVSMLFRILLDENHGAFNQVLFNIGLIDEYIPFLARPFTAQAAVALIQAWMWFGNSFLFLMAGVTGISKDYFEAAKVDGANRFQMFGKITLPLLKPIMLYVAITSLIGGMQIFELPLLITNGLGAPKDSLLTMVLLLYNQAVRFTNFGYGSTVAYGIFLITIVFSIIAYKIMYSNKKQGGVN